MGYFRSNPSTLCFYLSYLCHSLFEYYCQLIKYIRFVGSIHFRYSINYWQFCSCGTEREFMLGIKGGEKNKDKVVQKGGLIMFI